MNKILYSVVVLAALASCAEQYTESYNIQGSSSVSVLDGSKLYLKALMDDEMKDIDSCEVVHGGFGFIGRLDTTRLAMLSIRDGNMPLVIEKGDIRSFDSLLRIMRTLGKLDVLQPLIEEDQLSPSEYYKMVQSSKTTLRKRAAGKLNSNNKEESEW